MKKRFQIGVVGSSALETAGTSLITKPVMEIAYQVGQEIAKAGHILVCGGRDGVMEAVCRGAKEAGGLTVGILPSKDGSDANAYVDVRIQTGMGWLRNGFNAYCSDGMIVIAGSVGTLSEACYMYMEKRPLVAIRTTGGVAAQIAGTYLDDRKFVKCIGVDTAQEAVQQILSKLS